MPPALIRRAGAGTIERIDLKGLPLGSPAEVSYRSTCIELAEGDTVLLMSDGFPELFSPDREMLGYDRAADVFARAGEASPDEVIRHLRETTEAWTGGRRPDDDVTFVVLTIKCADRKT